MKSRRIGDFEIASDGVTVWVNGPDGSSTARFGRMGIDIHRSMAEQIASRDPCLQCTHAPTTRADWDTFKAGMLKHYGLEIPDKYMPERFRDAHRVTKP